MNKREQERERESEPFRKSHYEQPSSIETHHTVKQHKKYIICSSNNTACALKKLNAGFVWFGLVLPGLGWCVILCKNNHIIENRINRDCRRVV